LCAIDCTVYSLAGRWERIGPSYAAGKLSVRHF
jgi:hypothetical protein